jgi:hypothetical protein
VTFTWDAPPGRPSSYVIDAETSSGSANLTVADTGSAAALYVASGVEPGSYLVSVRARNACGVGAGSSAIVVTVR